MRSGRFVFASVSDGGRSRKNNEDTVGDPAILARVVGPPERLRERGALFAVADGMGGHSRGELLNEPIDAATAKEITGIFTEVVIAPGASDEAKAIFAAKKNLRLLTTAARVVLPAKRHLAVLVRHQTPVRDRYPRHVPRQVLEHRLWTLIRLQRRLAVHVPVLLI